MRRGPINLRDHHRNGSSGKTVLTDDGALRIAVPRDRHGAFEPQIVGKHERRFTGFDDKIIALYALSEHFWLKRVLPKNFYSPAWLKAPMLVEKEITLDEKGVQTKSRNHKVHYLVIHDTG
jgi:hypothetical protein